MFTERGFVDVGTLESSDGGFDDLAAILAVDDQRMLDIASFDQRRSNIRPTDKTEASAADVEVHAVAAQTELALHTPV